MDRIDRSLPNNFSSRSLLFEISSDGNYEYSRKESFGSDTDNGISDERPLLSEKYSYWEKIKNTYFDNKSMVINKMLSVTIHIFIMVIFEIYFYFNYVIYLEKEEFMDKIKSYLTNLNDIQINPIQKMIVSKLITENSAEITAELYANYIKSLNEQNLLKNQLLIYSYKMAGIVGSILCFFFLWGLLNWRQIRWKSIIIRTN